MFKKFTFLLFGILKFGRHSFSKHHIFSSLGNNVSTQKNSIIKLGGNLWFGVQANYGGSWFKKKQTQLYMDKNSAFITKGNCTIGGGSLIWIGESGILEIGNKTYINMDCKIFCKHHIKIGEKCAIAWNVSIIDNDFHPVIENGSIETDIIEAKSCPVIIEDNVWIGCNVTILKGVKIGKGSIIAAGTVVNKDVPENSLVGSNNELRLIKSQVSWRL